MNIEQAASFLAISILMSLGAIALVIGAVAINNIIHRYWKNFGWNFFPMYVGKEPVNTYEEFKDYVKK
jgi:hypothetical protein